MTKITIFNGCCRYKAPNILLLFRMTEREGSPVMPEWAKPRDKNAPPSVQTFM